MTEPYEPDQREMERIELREEVRESLRQWRHGRPHDARMAWDHDGLVAPPPSRWRRLRRRIGRLLTDWGLR